MITAKAVRKKVRDVLTCGGIDSSEHFVKDYCEELVKNGIYESVEECMESEGNALAEGLGENPHQKRIVSGYERVDAVREISEKTWLGQKSGYAEQYRYPTENGDIHSHEDYSGGTAFVHRDVCPPSRPIRHIAVDYFCEDETAKELEI